MQVCPRKRHPKTRAKASSLSSERLNEHRRGLRFHSALTRPRHRPGAPLTTPLGSGKQEAAAVYLGSERCHPQLMLGGDLLVGGGVKK